LFRLHFQEVRLRTASESPVIDRDHLADNQLSGVGVPPDAGQKERSVFQTVPGQHVAAEVIPVLTCDSDSSG
jgi:hypothetical protein